MKISNVFHKVVVLIVLSSFISQSVFADTFLVNDTGVGNDVSPGDGSCSTMVPGVCTLKAAIMEANTRAAGDIVDFDPAYITDGMEINDSTGLSAISNGNFTLQNSTDNRVGIKNDGGGGTGLTISGDNFTINGDADADPAHSPKIFIYNYGSSGIEVGNAAENTSILNTVIGLDIAGDVYSGANGISVSGQETLIQGNVIGGSGRGISVSADAKDLTIDNNYIGTDVSGTVDMGGSDQAIGISGGGVTYNGDDGGIGGNGVTISGNVISGYGTVAIDFYNFSDTYGTVSITDNKIGVDVSGENPIPNGAQGIQGYPSSRMDWTVTGNVISANNGAININNGASANISNNYIGVSGSGLNGVGLGNGGTGINIGLSWENDQYGVDNIIIADNVIGNTEGAAVVLSGGNIISAIIQGNRIGVAYDGDSYTDPAPNTSGITVNSLSVTSLVIGGGTEGEGNVIASGSEGGIDIQNVSVDGIVTIQGNYVGVAEDGVTVSGLGNGGHGIGIYGQRGNVTIGGDNNIGIDGSIGEGNVISNNTGSGIQLGEGVGDIVGIYGNVVGLVRGAESGNFDTVAGNSLEYGGGGIQAEGAPVVVGATVADGANSESSRRNIVSGNLRGIVLGNYESVVKNNYIGTDVSGTADCGNLSYGIGVGMGGLASGETVTIGGTSTADRNVISGNGGSGISTGDYFGEVTLNILGNFIGLNASGDAVIANEMVGVLIGIDGAGVVNIGNGLSGGGNVISGNSVAGILMDSYDTVSILGNYIGTDATGEAVTYGDSGVFGNGFNAAYGSNMGGIAVVAEGTVNIGGGDLTDANKRNVISGNFGQGVVLMGSAGAVIDGNYIGTDKDGDTDLGNVIGDTPFAETSNGSGIAVLDGNGVYTNRTVIGGETEGVSGNLISGNDGNGISIIHAASGLGQDWTNGYIKNSILGFAIDGITALPNGGYGIYVEDTVDPDPLIFGHFVGLMIGGSNNAIETSSNYGIYLLEVSEQAIHGVSYDWFTEHNSFSNPLLAWQALYRGVLQNGEEEEEGAVCGNDEEEEGEECDDGNTEDGDGCSSVCETEGGGGAPILIISPLPQNPPRDPDPVSDPDPVPEEDDVELDEPVVEVCTGDQCGQVDEQQPSQQDVKQATPTGKSHVSTSGGTSSSTSSSVVIVDHNDECKTDSDCGSNSSCERSVGGRVCMERKPIDCTVTDGIVDANGNTVPDCLEPQIVDSSSAQLPKEVADKVVFGLTGVVPTVPTIANLDGKIVDQNPLILVTYKPEVEVSLMIERAEPTKKLVITEGVESDSTTGKKDNVALTVLKDVDVSEKDREIEIGKTVIDREYKGQIAVDNPLPEGKYYATLLASDGMKSKRVSFEVANTNMEIEELKVIAMDKDDTSEIQLLAKQVLQVVESVDDSGRFVADEYVSYKNSQNKAKIYRIYAKINSQDKERKIAYFTYKSTIFASVALTDANDQGEYIDILIPEYVARNEQHTLSAYLSDAKNTRLSSKKVVQFVMQ